MNPWLGVLLAVLYGGCPLDGDFLGPILWIDDLIVAYLAYRNWHAQMHSAVTQERVIETRSVDHSN